jgi:alkylation response protein AidB-like acyl-CoA dehydrogenase
MAMHGTVDTLLDRVKAIAPMLRASAAEAEAQRRLARPVVDALRQAGLYSMAHPKTFGGLEVDPLTMFRVVEDVDTTATRAIGAAAPGTISYMYGAKWSGNHPLRLERKANACRADGGDTRNGRRHPYKGCRQGRRPG